MVFFVVVWSARKMTADPTMLSIMLSEVLADLADISAQSGEIVSEALEESAGEHIERPGRPT